MAAIACQPGTPLSPRLLQQVISIHIIHDNNREATNLQSAYRFSAEILIGYNLGFDDVLRQ
jgi:hypothetical protein